MLSARTMAVIPCLNEARTLASLIRSIRRHVPAVLVIDDGSSDTTAEIGCAAGAQVLSHPTTLGKGAALRSGCERARKLGFDWAVTLDGDGQHSPDDIPRFLAAAAADSRVELWVGNRMTQPERMPFVRRGVNRWMSARLSRVAGTSWPDTQCGFRMFQLHTWSRLPLHTDNFEVESEMLLAFHCAGAAIGFVPIEVIYRSERSKIRPLPDSCRWLTWFWRHARRIPARAPGSPLPKPASSRPKVMAIKR